MLFLIKFKFEYYVQRQIVLFSKIKVKILKILKISFQNFVRIN